MALPTHYLSASFRPDPRSPPVDLGFSSDEAGEVVGRLGTSVPVFGGSTPLLPEGLKPGPKRKTGFLAVTPTVVSPPQTPSSGFTSLRTLNTSLIHGRSFGLRDNIDLIKFSIFVGNGFLNDMDLPSFIQVHVFL